MTGSRAKRRCMFTAEMTLSPKPRYSSEERATRRSRHCQAFRQKTKNLGSHSNSIVVVYFLSWAVIEFTRLATLILPQNPRRNHCTPISSTPILYTIFVCLSTTSFRQKKTPTKEIKTVEFGFRSTVFLHQFARLF